MLRDAGEEGVTNKELNEICLRYGARLNELYSMGYKIDKELISNGVYRYVLRKEPSEITIHANAGEIIYYKIKQDFNNSITGEELQQALDEQDFYIIRKPNWYQNNMEG